MIKKIISLFFALLFVGSIAVIKPTQTEAATLSFTAQISTEITPKYEKAHMVFSRKLNGGTYSHIIGSDTNKNGIGFVGKTQLSDKTEFVITPLKEGTFDFAIGLYHYNGSSTDMTLCGILEFHVECKQRSDGRFYISNMDSSFAKSGCYSTRTRNVDRYNYIEFKDLSIEKGSGVITYKLTDNSKKDSEITSIAKKYSLEKYYLVNGKHVHSYNNSGVCSKCGIKRYDYNASGFQYLFYKTEAPEKGRLLTVNPKTSDGKTLGIPVQVYLPYGYQNTNKYDVLFLVPGSNGTIYNWMGQSMEMYIPGGEKFDEMSGKRLFDWLIYTRQSKPFIAVSIPMQPYNDSYDQAYSRYVMLIKDYWLPMIIDGQGVYSDGNGNNKEIKLEVHTQNHQKNLILQQQNLILQLPDYHRDPFSSVIMP